MPVNRGRVVGVLQVLLLLFDITFVYVSEDFRRRLKVLRAFRCGHDSDI